jgi:hypothetical protein
VTVRASLVSVALAMATACPVFAATSNAPVVQTLLTSDDVPDAIALSVPKPLGVVAFEREANSNAADRAKDAAELRKAGFEAAAIIHILTSKQRGIDVYSIKVRPDAAAGVALDEAVSSRKEPPAGLTIAVKSFAGLPAASVLTYRLATGAHPIVGVAVLFARGPYVALVGVTGEKPPPEAYVVKLARLMDGRIRAVE